MHGGLSPELRTLDQVPVLLCALVIHPIPSESFVEAAHDTIQVRTIERVCEIPHEGPFCDLMWSDPEDIDTWYAFNQMVYHPWLF